jgi:hypothetical protein
MDKFTLKDGLECLVNVYSDSENFRQVVRSVSSIQSEGHIVVGAWADIVRVKNIFNAFSKGDLEKETKYHIGKCQFSLNLENSRPSLLLICHHDENTVKSYEFNRIEAQANSEILNHIIIKCDIVYPAWLMEY